jgi:hypothetical protein
MRREFVKRPKRRAAECQTTDGLAEYLFSLKFAKDGIAEG